MHLFQLDYINLNNSSRPLRIGVAVARTSLSALEVSRLIEEDKGQNHHHLR